MESMGSSIVRFKGVVSNVYLCMDDEGVCHVKVRLFMTSKVLKSFRPRLFDFRIAKYSFGSWKKLLWEPKQQN